MGKVVLTNRNNKKIITANKCDNIFSESLERKKALQLIKECVDRYLRNKLHNKLLYEAKKANANDANFEKWKSVFNVYLSEMIDELQTNYLNQLGLTIMINPNYVFNGWKSRWLAVYERSSQQILNGIISIAINYPHLYSEMCKRRIDKDKFNIEAQAKITVGHEIGHGLVDYIKRRTLEPSELKELPNLAIIRKCGERKEETLVEEFGQYQFPEATSMYDSVLADALEELATLMRKTTTKQLKENLKTHDDEYNIYEKLDELDIEYDFINDKENIIKIQTPDENTRNKAIQLLNYYGWKNIKDDKHSICAERIYGDKWNNFYDTEAENDEEDYPYGVGIYYHITLPSKTPKLLKQGLTVREGNKLGYKRGKRTYLLSYPSMVLACDLFKKKEDEKVKVNILLVDIRKYLGKQINLYHDDFTYDEGAVYTYDYIPPQCISIYQTLEI